MRAAKRSKFRTMPSARYPDPMDLQLGTVPIPKANRPEHFEENFRVFHFEISADDRAALDGLNEVYSGTLPYLRSVAGL